MYVSCPGPPPGPGPPLGPGPLESAVLQTCVISLTLGGGRRACVRATALTRGVAGEAASMRKRKRALLVRWWTCMYACMYSASIIIKGGQLAHKCALANTPLDGNDSFSSRKHHFYFSPNAVWSWRFN